MNMAVPDSVAVVDSRTLPRWLLIVGLVAGVAAATIGLMERPNTLPPHAVAMVNHRPILRDAWLRAVAAVAAERRTPLSAADQRHILDRLIDEELLVQHGLALGLAEYDGRIRSELVSQVMQTASATAAGADEAALRQFYADNESFFAAPARLRIAAWRELADGRRADFVPAVPDALLPPSTLQRYLGPALTATALGLSPGQRTNPIGPKRVVLEALNVQPGTAPPFEEIRDQVRREAKRRADEAAVRALLADLRRSGTVIVEPDLP
jgi:hypothetical protein